VCLAIALSLRIKNGLKLKTRRHPSIDTTIHHPNPE
jgi:hypothetical protein